jgi:hypothetical protein
VLSTDKASASGGVLTLTPTASNPKSGVFVMTAKPWSLDESQVTVNVRQVVASSGMTQKVLFVNPADVWNDELGFWYERNVVYLYTMNGGVETDWATIPWSAIDDAWLRLRESGTTLYWETSPDGVTWTTRASAPDSATQVPLGAGLLYFDVKETNAGSASPGQGKLGGLNAH